MEDGEPLDLLDDVAHVDGGRRCTPFLDLVAESPQVVGRDLGQQPVLPNRQDVAIKDRLARVLSAIRASLNQRLPTAPKF